MYSPFKNYNMKPNFNNCSDIKGLRFFTKEICPYYCCFLHTQKDSGGASIHRIDESFPLKPSLDYLLYILIMGVTIHDTLLDMIDFYNWVKKRTNDKPASVDTYPIVQFHPNPVLHSI